MANDGTIKIGVDLDEAGLAKKLSGLTSSMTKILAGTSAALTAALKPVVSIGMEFEKAMSGVKAVSGATEDEMNKLTAAAMKAGADTVYSASEAANAIEELLKAGLNVEQVLGGGLTGALDLAAAGEIGLAQAAEVASTVLNAFRDDQLSVADAADILAGAANASATDVAGMGQGLSNAAATASTAGMSFRDTATALAEFAQNGIEGAEAGTLLKSLLLNLQPATDGQVAAMKELGLMTKEGKNQFFDATGKLKSFAEISELLKTSMADLSQEERLATMNLLFGTRAVNAAAIMFKEGAEGANAMADAISAIAAEDVAAARLDNLAGDVEALSGSAETLVLGIYQQLLPALRSIVQEANTMVDDLQTAFDEGGMDGLVSAIGDMLADVVTKLAEGAPDMVSAGSQLLANLLTGITDNSDTLTTAAVDLMKTFISGLGTNGEAIINAIAQLIKDGAPKLPELVPEIIEAGAKIATALVEGIAGALPAITDAVGGIITQGNLVTNALLAIGAAIAAFKMGSAIAGGINTVTTAIKGLGAAASANPLGVFIAALALTVAAVAAVRSEFGRLSAESQAAIDATNALADALKEDRQAAYDSEDAANKKIDAMRAQAAFAKTLIAEIDELSQKEERSGQETGLMVEKIKQLNSLMPALGVAYDVAGDSLNRSTEMMNGFVDASVKQGEITALQEKQVNLHQRLEEAQSKRQAATENLDNAERKLAETGQVLSFQLENGVRVYNRLDDNLLNTNGATNALIDNYNNAAIVVGEANSRIKEAQDNIDRFDVKIGENSAAIGEFGNVYGAAAENAVRTGEIMIDEAEQISEAYTDMNGNIYDAAGNIVDANGMIIASAADVPAYLEAQAKAAQDAAAAQEEASKREVKALEDAKKAFEANLDVVGNMFSKNKADAALGVNDLIENLKFNAAQEKSFQDNLGKLAEAGVDKGLIDKLESEGPKAAETAAKMVKDLEKGGTDKLDELNTAWATSVQLALDATKKEIEGTEFDEAAGAMLDELAKALTKGDQLKTATATALTKTTEAEVPTAGLEAKGKEVIDAVETGETNNADDIKTGLQTAVDGAKTVSVSGFDSIGLNMCEGVKSGITSGASSIYNAITAIALGAMQAFKTALGIASPAKKMIPDGEHVAEGIAVGISKGASVVQAAMGYIGDVITSMATAASAQAARDRADQIQQEIDAIEAKLTEYERMMKDKHDAEELAEKRAAVKRAKNKKDRVKAQEDLNRTLDRLENERLKTQQQNMQAELDAYRANVDTLVKAYDFLGDQIIVALKNRYEKERDMQMEALEARYKADLEAAEKTFDLQQKSSEAYLAQLETIKNAEIYALQSRIDAINAEKKAEQDAERERKDAEKIAELQAAVDRAKNAKFRTAAQEALDAELAKQALEARERERQAEIESLKAQIDDIKDNYDEQKELEEARMDEVEAAYKAQTETIKANYDAQKAYYEAFYRDLLSQEKLNAEARRLLLQESNDEMIALLETYNPEWYNAGKSFGELFVEALGVQMDNVNDMIERVATFAENKLDWIKAQVAEMQAVSGVSASDIASSIRSGSGGIQTIYTEIRGQTVNGSTTYVDQTIEFNQPIQSPAEAAWAVKKASQEAAYAL